VIALMIIKWCQRKHSYGVKALADTISSLPISWHIN